MKSTTMVGAGLFLAWAAHDSEEWLTMAPTSRDVFARMPRWVPIPEGLRSHGLSQRHVNVALGLMAIPVAAASLAGIRSEGRSSWFRGALLAFGLHGFTHLGNSVAARSYTSGVATAPVIVVPYWLLARRVLRRQGITEPDLRITLSALATVPLTLGVHLVTAALLGEKSLGAEPEPDRRCGPQVRRHSRT